MVSNERYLINEEIDSHLRQGRVVGGPAGQAMAGPVLDLFKQYIGLETYKIILQLTIQMISSLPRILFTLSYDKLCSSIVGFIYSATGYSV